VAPAEKDKLFADLSAYLDGELSPRRAREIERLLAESAEARQMLADLRGIADALAALPRKRAPADLPQRVRREAERQVLLQEPAGLRRGRVIRLALRLTASAAVIAGCLFAGWTVLKQERPVRRAPARESAEARRPPREQIAAAPATPGGELPEVAVATEQAIPNAADHVAPAHISPVYADADRPVVVFSDREAPAFRVGIPIAATQADVSVNLTVLPRTAEEYEAALETITVWTRPVAHAETGAPRRGADAHRGHDVFQRQQDFVVRLRPEEFNGLLVTLGERLPGQVQASMNFNARALDRVQMLVNAPPRAPTHVAKSREPRAGRPVAAASTDEQAAPVMGLVSRISARKSAAESRSATKGREVADQPRTSVRAAPDAAPVAPRELTLAAPRAPREPERERQAAGARAPALRAFEPVVTRPAGQTQPDAERARQMLAALRHQAVRWIAPLWQQLEQLRALLLGNLAGKPAAASPAQQIEPLDVRVTVLPPIGVSPKAAPPTTAPAGP